MEALEQLQLVVDVQDCVSAVDDVERTLWERPPCGIGHLKLDLMHRALR